MQTYLVTYLEAGVADEQAYFFEADSREHAIEQLYSAENHATVISCEVWED